MTVFLDRDGTLIHDYGRNHLGDLHRIRFLPGVFEGLALLSRAGVRLIVVTNQGAVNMGLLSFEGMRAMNKAVSQILAGRGIHLNAIFYCPHSPGENCGCRKPRDGMGTQARLRTEVMGRLFMVGDKGVDVGFGRAIGARTILLPRGDGGSLLEGWDMKPDFRAPDFQAAVRWILRS